MPRWEVGGVLLTGFAWQYACLLLLPPTLASAGAGFASLVLNRMALQSPVPAVADLRPGHAHITFGRWAAPVGHESNAARACRRERTKCQSQTTAR
jgi:hypothetical protein